MGDDDKPFACTEEGCGMRFSNEDHLSVHRMKHEMSLSLAGSSGKLTSNFLFVDQTPTPTKFLKNCEEVGLFHELNKNPFEEAFKKAAQEHLPHTSSADVTEIVVHVPLPGPSHEVKSTLDTPQVQLEKENNHIQQEIIIEHPSPGIHAADNDIETETVEIGEEWVVETEPNSAAVQEVEPCGPSPMSQPLSSPEQLQPVDLSSDKRAPCRPIETTAAPLPVAGLIVSSAATIPVVTNVPLVQKPAVSTVSVAPSLTTAVLKQPQVATMQVLLQLPNGQTVPVHIPAAISSPTLQITPPATPAVNVAPKIASKRPATVMAAATSTSSLAKQKLKQALVNNAQQSILNSNMKVMTEAVDRVTAQRSPSQLTNVLVTTANQPSPSSSTATSPSNLHFLHMDAATNKARPQIEMQDADTSTPMFKKLRKGCDDDADERRRKFLERNRAAAARCRMKRKSWIVNLEKKADEMQSHNSKIVSEMVMLRKEVAHLKMLLLAHKDCPVTKAQQAAGQLPDPLHDVQTYEIQDGCLQSGAERKGMILKTIGTNQAIVTTTLTTTSAEPTFAMQSSPSMSDISISDSQSGIIHSPDQESPTLD